MSDWEIGFRRGYRDAAFRITPLPVGDYSAVWSEQRDTLKFENGAQVQAGYVAGSNAAMLDGPIR